MFLVSSESIKQRLANISGALVLTSGIGIFEISEIFNRLLKIIYNLKMFYNL